MKINRLNLRAVQIRHPSRRQVGKMDQGRTLWQMLTEAESLQRGANNNSTVQQVLMIPPQNRGGQVTVHWKESHGTEVCIW